MIFWGALIYPQMTLQKEGYSDIEKENKKYELQILEDVIEIKDAPNNYNEETKDFTLKLKNISDEDLPYVSILTPTKNKHSV